MSQRYRPRCRFTLTATQHKTIDIAARALPPEERHGFLLRVSLQLRLGQQPPGFVSDQLVAHAIDYALTEEAFA